MFGWLSARAVCVSAFCAIGMTATAQDIAVPQGTVILTITGATVPANVDGTLQFDRDTFVALGTETITTTTNWTSGVQTFEGVPLATLAALFAVETGVFKATAINDYTVEIPVSDAVVGGPIVAVKLNGANMSLRDKGPLWIVYPFDDAPAYQSEVIYSRSIWQLDRIDVVD